MASHAEEWRWAVESLKEVSAFAADHDVTPGIEPLNRFETYFIQELGSGLISAADYDRAVESNIRHLKSVGA